MLFFISSKNQIYFYLKKNFINDCRDLFKWTNKWMKKRYWINKTVIKDHTRIYANFLSFYCAFFVNVQTLKKFR